MNETVRASIDAQLAELSHLVEPPLGGLGYGTDLSCVTDLTPTLDEVDPSSPKAIVEAVIRRYTTPRGGLADDQDYGLDIRGHLSRGVTQRDLRALSGALVGEAMKDDRVVDANVELAASLRGSAAQIRVEIIPADPEQRQFDFTFAVTSADVLMVTINA